MKYRGMVLLKEEGHPIKKCCELLKLSFSGFHKWLKRRPSKRKQEDKKFTAKIEEIFNKSNKTYGSPRIREALLKEGLRVGRDRISRLMREAGLQVKMKKSFRPKTTINNPFERKSPRKYKIESTKVTRPNQVWASDLTYIPTDEGFVYLVVVMDLFNREIKGWDVSSGMEAENTKNAFVEAIKGVDGKLEGLVFHSDQGIQYCSKMVRQKLEFLGITQSMSRKGNCYDNAIVESFFHTLKNELPKMRFKNLAEVRKEVFKYIETWYNTERMHSSLGYKSPVEYAEAS